MRDWLVGEDGPIDQMEEEDEYDDAEESGSGHESEETPSVVRRSLSCVCNRSLGFKLSEF